MSKTVAIRLTTVSLAPSACNVPLSVIVLMYSFVPNEKRVTVGWSEQDTLPEVDVINIIRALLRFLVVAHVTHLTN